MQIQRAKPGDLPTILDIIDQARIIMRENGNLTQWADGYPSGEVILSDINSGHGFLVVSDDEILGYFCFMKGKNVDPNYSVIENGSWPNEDEYGVIHRLASGRKAKGIAKAAFDFAFSEINNVRVDTHHDNIPMQHFLRKIGFDYCGIIYVQDGTARDAFQLIKES